MYTLEDIFTKYLKGATFIGIDTLTNVVLTGGKKNQHQGRVTKTVTGSNVMAFANKAVNGYEAMVHRRLIAEGKNPNMFELSPRAWGTRRNGVPIVDHKGEEYLEVIFMRAGEVNYQLDGQLIDRAQIEGLAEKPEGEQGGLDNKVIIRTYKAASIVTLRVAEHTFKPVMVGTDIFWKEQV